jgi:hypothetical protein
MNLSVPVRLPIDYDAFGLAVGSAVISGALALLEPFLVALTGALAALALAGWMSWRRRRSARWTELGHPRPAAALGVLLVGVLAFAVLPEPWAEFRGLALGLALVPLWLHERHRSGPAGGAPA